MIKSIEEHIILDCKSRYVISIHDSINLKTIGVFTAMGLVYQLIESRPNTEKKTYNNVLPVADSLPPLNSLSMFSCVQANKT